MSTIPFWPYKLFFLYVEPVSALLGALYAGRPAEYLSLIVPASSPLKTVLSTPSIEVSISLYQLSNLYLLFALNEHLVLSSTESVRTWKRLLFCLLVADFGHLATNLPLGLPLFWQIQEWNAMTWGSIGFVYVGAAMRLSYLFGLGLTSDVIKRE
ncbi:hypothetical protein SCHPADRAFT_686252 [Schizopora paradoxa]|uniref:DUF7704 domain-containing protein n=1 Tax=Schizopora paradoxa TaxID=27342 RepID=A0A0H2R482_9AGAM|nr:hypothetical protein SCHPADRAFT_686252 [Schizopora paradoxa]